MRKYRRGDAELLERV
ncbi:Protein of unknown function [Bacillus toyonensis]|nr:Protein of unknown function [Bacillus toyonensis]